MTSYSTQPFKIVTSAPSDEYTWELSREIQLCNFRFVMLKCSAQINGILIMPMIKVKIKICIALSEPLSLEVMQDSKLRLWLQ